MTATQTLATVLADCIGSLGAGVLLGISYHMLRFITGDARHSTAVRDILFAPIAALLSYSYAVTYSFVGVLRWYILVFILIGLLSYRSAIMKRTFSYERKLKYLLLIPLRLLWSKTLYIVVRVVGTYKKRKIVKRKSQKPLQKGLKVVYNSDTTLN